MIQSKKSQLFFTLLFLMACTCLLVDAQLEPYKSSVSNSIAGNTDKELAVKITKDASCNLSIQYYKNNIDQYVSYESDGVELLFFSNVSLSNTIGYVDIDVTNSNNRYWVAMYDRNSEFDGSIKIFNGRFGQFEDICTLPEDISIYMYIKKFD